MAYNIIDRMPVLTLISKPGIAGFYVDREQDAFFHFRAKGPDCGRVGFKQSDLYNKCFHEEGDLQAVPARAGSVLFIN